MVKNVKIVDRIWLKEPEDLFIVLVYLVIYNYPHPHLKIKYYQNAIKIVINVNIQLLHVQNVNNPYN